MRYNKKHIPKSASQKAYYYKAIKNQDYEPTVDETLPFAETDDTEKDFSVSKSRRPRKPPVSERIRDHIEDNWIAWIITAAAIVLFFFMVDARIGISNTNTNVDNLVQDVLDLEESDEGQSDKLHQYELDIQENKFEINSLKNDVNSFNK